MSFTQSLAVDFEENLTSDGAAPPGSPEAALGAAPMDEIEEVFTQGALRSIHAAQHWDNLVGVTSAAADSSASAAKGEDAAMAAAPPVVDTNSLPPMTGGGEV